jgi:predicted DNA-binding protein (MmcQ/YjbR family)
MDQKSIKRYFLNKPQTIEDYPFGPEVAVYKVKGKMFATFSIHNDCPAINLKCEPDEACALRDIFKSVIAGYHMNKRHWNTVYLDGTVPKGEIERMVDNSYLLVVNKMTKKDQQSILIHL